jgi:hypothetical protein
MGGEDGRSPPTFPTSLFLLSLTMFKGVIRTAEAGDFFKLHGPKRRGLGGFLCSPHTLRG